MAALPPFSAAPSVRWSAAELSSQALSRRFVGQTAVLRALVGRLGRSAESAEPPHRLVVGPPGSGRTALLRRVEVAVADHKELSARWRAVRLPERLWRASRLSDLWLIALETLLPALVAEGRDGDMLQSQLDALLSIEDDARVDVEALDLLCAWAGRGVALLIDGLDHALGRIDGGAAALARRLEEEPRLLVLATADEALNDAALKGVFSTLTLTPLSEAEAQSLVARLGEGAQRVVTTEPGRLRAAIALFGAWPRPLALLGAAWCEDPSGDATTDLTRLLDALRPAHAARLAELPPQSQQVLSAIAERWDPVPAGPLSRSLRMQVRLTSAQLSRLSSLGFVEKVDLPQHARLGFQLRDRALGMSLLRGAAQDELRGLAELVSLTAPPQAHEPLAPFIGPDPDLKTEAKIRKERMAALRARVPTTRPDWPTPWSSELFTGVLLTAPISLSARERVLERLRAAAPDEVKDVALALAYRLGLVGLLHGEATSQALAQASLSGELSGPDDLPGAESAARRLRQPGLLGLVRLTRAARRAAEGDLDELAMPFESDGGTRLAWSIAAARFPSFDARVKEAVAAAWAQGVRDDRLPVAAAWAVAEGGLPMHADESELRRGLTRRPEHPLLLAGLGALLTAQDRRDEAERLLRNAAVLLQDGETVAACLPETLASYFFDALEDGSLADRLLRPLRGFTRRPLATLLLRDPNRCGEALTLLGADGADPRLGLFTCLRDELRAGRPAVVSGALAALGLDRRWRALDAAARASLDGPESLRALPPELRAVAEGLLRP